MNSDNQFRMLNAVKAMAKHKDRVGLKNRKERRDDLKASSTSELYRAELKAAKKENARRRDLRMARRTPISGQIKLST